MPGNGCFMLSTASYSTQFLQVSFGAGGVLPCLDGLPSELLHD
jgi:hypothetical protein